MVDVFRDRLRRGAPADRSGRGAPTQGRSTGGEETDRRRPGCSLARANERALRVILPAMMRGIGTLSLVTLVAVGACAGGEGSESRGGSATETTVGPVTATDASGTATEAPIGTDSASGTTPTEGGGTDSATMGTTAVVPTTTEAVTTEAPTESSSSTTGAPCEPVQCSVDLKGLECEGRLVSLCEEDSYCIEGVCTPLEPCEAAALLQGSEGCEFWAVKTQTTKTGGCFAAFVANTWDEPVHIEVEYDVLATNAAKQPPVLVVCVFTAQNSQPSLP